MPYNMLERIHPHKTTQTDIQSSSTNHISTHHHHAPTVETMCILLHRLYNTHDATNHTPTQYNKTKPTQTNCQH